MSRMNRLIACVATILYFYMGLSFSLGTRFGVFYGTQRESQDPAIFGASFKLHRANLRYDRFIEGRRLWEHLLRAPRCDMRSCGDEESFLRARLCFGLVWGFHFLVLVEGSWEVAS